MVCNTTGVCWSVVSTDYSVYIIRCQDQTYYTGIAADVQRRLKEHQSGPKGAKYLKGRGPLTLVYSEIVGNRSIASRIEYRIKCLDRSQKEALINGCKTVNELMPNQDATVDSE